MKVKKYIFFDNPGGLGFIRDGYGFLIVSDEIIHYCSIFEYGGESVIELKFL